jgi:WD40 repeat protein
MAGIRIGSALVLSLLLFAAAASAADQSPAATPGLHDRPVLVVDPGKHTGTIKRADVDAMGRWAVTGSDDKTLRVWSLADGALLRMIRLPAGPGNVGKVYAVAMSPDGALIAAGGWTRTITAYEHEQIYLFDRATGALVRRIDDLPNVVNHLAFSPDGHRLAATLGTGGLRLYGREQGWVEVARDVDYGGQSYGASFATDGRLATTGYDGKVRLYASDLQGDVRPVATIPAPGGQRPYGIAFSPDGTRLAIGYDDSTVVDLLDGHTLEKLPGPDLAGIDNGDLSKIAWSSDGRTLFAAGRYRTGGRSGPLVLAWSDAGAGARRALTTSQDTAMSLVPLPEGDLLVAARDPWLAQLRADGSARWMHGPPKADFRGQFDRLSVSSDGTRIDFEPYGKAPVRFDLATRALTLDPPTDARMSAPRPDGLSIKAWKNTTRPTLDGRPLQLSQYETSRSLAIHPVGDRFVLGTEWSLRAFDAKGTLLWSQQVPDIVWAVNITGDGRLVVAAYGDGTIRWHRMTDGVELLAFMPLPDKTNWVAWTPEGFYAATAGAQGILRWHTNHGWDAPADSVAIEDIPGSYRPALIPLVLQELETPRALGLAVLAEHNRQIVIRTNSRLAPGTRLHLLTIGIDAYNEDYARHLRLQYAGRDAQDLASAIVNTQGALYADVKPQVLRDKDASKLGIVRALATMRTGMQAGGGNDMAVVHFSGHGALVDGKLYLLPYEVDARDPAGIRASGLSIGDLKDELLELARHGRVLVLLDACHSGATTMAGAALATDSTALRTGLAAANVTVLTSSSGSQVSREDPAWEHGAFTKVLLDALTDSAADTDRNGLIGAIGLADYVASRVSLLTGGAQSPGMEIRYKSTVFATGR